MKAFNLVNQATSLRGSGSVAKVLFAIALVASFAQFGAVSSLNDVAKHFGHVAASGSLQSKVGLSGSVLGVGLAVLRLASLMALPMASLADRFGRKKILQRTLVVGLLATATAALSPAYWFFVACFALARPLLSASSTLVQVVTVELSSTHERIHRLAVISAGAGIGAGLSAVLHGIIRGPNSFRWLFAVAIIPVFLLSPLLERIEEPTRRVDDATLARLGAVPGELRERLVIICAVAFAVGMVTGPANGFAFVYGEGVLKISPQFVAGVVASSALTGLGGLVFGRYLAKRHGRRWTVGVGVLATALTSTFAYSGGKVNFTCGYLVGVGAAGVLAPAASALSTEVFSHRFRATAAAWVVVAGVLGATSGLFLFGFVGDALHTSGISALRIPAIVTFLPLLPVVFLLSRLPESAHMELS